MWPVNVVVTSSSGAAWSYDAVNIRQVDAVTKLFTKKGVFLRPNRWAGLKNHVDELTSNLTSKSQRQFNIGGGIKAGSGGKYPGISLRKFWRPADTLDVVASRKGIELTCAEWGRLVALIGTGTLEAPSPALWEACECSLSHNGQVEAAQCRECHPFDF